jgi:hypothetical protein
MMTFSQDGPPKFEKQKWSAEPPGPPPPVPPGPPNCASAELETKTIRATANEALKNCLKIETSMKPLPLFTKIRLV